MIGTGEYTTGYVHGTAADSDKSAGVIALSFFDMRRRGLVGSLMMAGTCGEKFPGIRKHLSTTIGDVYAGLSLDFESFPADSVERDPAAYRHALGQLEADDIVTVFTPDDTHFQIALEAIELGCHVLVAKPLVKTLDQHRRLIDAAHRYDCLVAMEVHKRWDPIYIDARDRIRNLGDFSFFSSYMSQPKSQLDTFRAWAGKSSDISYYLNAHHVDFHQWAVGAAARPVRVVASGASGYAVKQGIETEDTITLTVDWEYPGSRSRGTAVYTASWIAPKSDVHSQQRFFYLGQGGEITVDQAHRGYGMATDDVGFTSPNPLFMKYTPSATGHFVGQSGYGYRSLEAFVLAVRDVRADRADPAVFDDTLATAASTLSVTAILEAGRRSLDEKRAVEILYDGNDVVALK